MLRLVEIRTERLVLTPLDPDLVAALLAGDFSAVNCGEGWPHADTRDGLSIANECGGWLVTRSGLVIGDCGLAGAVTADGDVEIGYGLAFPSRGVGLGSELVKGLSDWLLEQERISRVVAVVDLDNRPSGRALESAGFVIDHVDERAATYALAAPAARSHRGGSHR
jgi:RimJ/RimL family protein N-acetyltransferase